MGYILPVTNYQYIQYAEREIGLDYDPFMINSVNRIRKEDPVLKGHEQQEQATAPMQKQKEHQPLSRMQLAASESSFPGMDRVYKKKVNPSVVSQAYAEITGKGRHYSESI
ncbi:hypothetical protein J7E38_04520 [Bacillus sp. ISL-35]|uniref:hypothetical protein n=1 Tax=Bacillus sp. ISL-35 TaxID=2819122 RepID=UPI001BE9E6B5|nr:hypothetical protein [Bacillus sp. ISL-35]MBT2678253.1 hypothetical protein [Bacillus sp. ISL-35]MBT2702460.1 hypothetical protein [Chryseobacterium sp. ISL-80]